MEEGLRRQYLQAMGFTVWERRDPPAGVEVDSVGEGPGRDPERLLREEQPAMPHPLPGKVPPLQPPQPPDQASDHVSQAPEIHGQGSVSARSLEDGEEPPPWDEVPPWADTPSWLADENGGDDIASLDWDALRERVKGCRACALRAGCTQTVFGVGNPKADLMVIGEAPGADEDRQGEPFVGRAGQLLNAMLLAIGLKREQVFIANVLKCRPPNNRDPRAEEALQCEPYLLRQIALVRPRVILSVGRISAQNRLKTEIPVGKLRGRVHGFGERNTPLVVTYHPAYLLRSPDQKGRAWEDLQLAFNLLRNSQA